MTEAKATTTDPTVTTNREAAKLACHTERDRVLAILAMAPAGSVPESIVQAIADGAPVAQVERSLQRAAGASGGSAARPATSTTPAKGGNKWDAITSRINEQRRAASDAAEGSAA
jgi:hypothetical protein